MPKSFSTKEASSLLKANSELRKALLDAVEEGGQLHLVGIEAMVFGRRAIDEHLLAAVAREVGLAVAELIGGHQTLVVAPVTIDVLGRKFRFAQQVVQ